MSKAKFDAAKELIQEKNYDEARRILGTIDHPTAREWEAKLDKLSPPKKISANKPALQPKISKARRGGCSRRFYGTLIVMVGLVILAIITNPSANRQSLSPANVPSENGTLEPSATITDTPLPQSTSVPAVTLTSASQVTPISPDVYYVMNEANARLCPNTQCDALVQFPKGQLITVDAVIRGGTFKDSTLWYRT